jgi:hypothetical protein
VVQRIHPRGSVPGSRLDRPGLILVTDTPGEYDRSDDEP